jgi:hypothetical protein
MSRLAPVLRVARASGALAWTAAEFVASNAHLAEHAARSLALKIS